MKKLLSILGSFALSLSTASTIVACGKKEEPQKPNLNPATDQEKVDDALVAIEAVIKGKAIDPTKADAKELEKIVTDMIKSAINSSDVILEGLKLMNGNNDPIEDKDLSANDIDITASGTIKVNKETRTFAFKFTSKVASEQYVVDIVKNLLDKLDFNLSVNLNVATVDMIIDEIKKSSEFINATADHRVKEENMKLFESDGTTPADQTYLRKDDNKVIVSGDLIFNQAKNNFKFTIKLEQKTDLSKQKANDAVTALNGLTGFTFNLADFSSTKTKRSQLNDWLLAKDEIKAIITGDIKVKTDKFTLKVGNDIVSSKNIKENSIVTVSGKIEVNGQESDNEFTFTIKIKSLPVETDKKKQMV